MRNWVTNSMASEKKLSRFRKHDKQHTSLNVMMVYLVISARCSRSHNLGRCGNGKEEA